MKKLKFRKSLTTNIVVIFLLFNIISVMIFTFYMRGMGQSESSRYAEQSSLEIIKEKSELISIVFDRIRNRTELLELCMEDILTESVPSKLDENKYYIAENGILFRKFNPQKTAAAQSNIFALSKEKITQALIREINQTEKLEPYFRQIIENEDITWCYITTKDNLLRCAPYSNLNNSFQINHNHIGDIFYTQADETNNPEHASVWTAPYIDYLGTGWTITCSKPVYDSAGNLYGVVCVDVSIEKVKEKYLNGFSLGNTGKLCWMTQEGNLYYHTDYENLTGKQGTVLEKNIFEEDMSAAKRKALEEVVSSEEESGTRTFTEDGKRKLILFSHISEIDALLFMEIEMSELNSFYNINLGSITMIILIDLILAIIFAIILYHTVSRPVGKLTQKAQLISDGAYTAVSREKDEEAEGYYEISRLNEAFRVMSANVEEYTENLLDKNREISTIVEAIDEALMIVDTDGNITLQSKDSVNIPPAILKHAVKKTIDEKQSYTEQIFSDGEAYRNAYYPIVKDGNVEQVVVSSECITKTVLLEKEIQQIEKMAGVGQLAAAIVHELKNILAQIKGAAYILAITDSKGEEVQTIQRAVDEAENVITTLLDFSRYDKNGSELIHIGTLINQILLLSKKEIIKRGIVIDRDLDDACYVNSAGREAIKVILQNIILNAIQAVDTDGHIEITCSMYKGFAVVSIKDDGKGIPAELREKIFEPFVTTKADGNGVGLWITKRLVDSLGGSIKIADPENGGTEFVVSIPMNREEA